MVIMIMTMIMLMKWRSIHAHDDDDDDWYALCPMGYDDADADDMMMIMMMLMRYTISGEEKPASSVGFGQMGKPNMIIFVLNFYVFVYSSNNIFLTCPHTSYLSHISHIRYVETKLSCGEISDLYR